MCPQGCGGSNPPFGTITQRQVYERGEARPSTLALKTGVGLVIDRMRCRRRAPVRLIESHGPPSLPLRPRVRRRPIARGVDALAISPIGGAVALAFVLRLIIRP